MKYTAADNAGAPFGPDNLIEWAGPPGVELKCADKSNAYQWRDDKGGAYRMYQPEAGIEEICHLFNVPPPMTGNTTKSDLTALMKSEGFSDAGFSDADKFGAALVGLTRMQNLCHFQAMNMGWWDKEATYRFDERVWKWALAAKHDLVHSELSEALEALRKDKMDDHLPHRKGFEVELADAVIRIFDLAGMCNLDLAAAIVEKLNYNLTRADHTREARAAAGGKGF